MATKYYRVTLKGEKPSEEIQPMLGRSGALLVRVHVEGGETRAYFAADESAKPLVAKALKGAKALTEVSIDEVTRLT
jgi:hypothetical protein